jgi:hypothetical protein
LTPRNRFNSELGVTLFLILLMIGVGGGISYYFLGVSTMMASPQPGLVSASVSTDGSTCSIQLRNGGSAPTALDSVIISYAANGGQPTESISFAPSNTVLQPGAILQYDCSLTGPAPFLPPFSASSASSFRIVASFKNGAQSYNIGSFSS